MRERLDGETVKRLNGKTDKILLIGDISKVFVDVNEVTSLCEVSSNIHDGVDAAAKNNFTGIVVTISGTSGKLSSSLKALREANRDAKIILLAQMVEEPMAMELVGRGFDGRRLADDYLICPIQFSYLESYIFAPHQCRKAWPSSLFGRKGAGGISAKEESIGQLVQGIDAKTKRKIELLEELATEDDLTRLKNRRYIWEFSRQILEQARRENGRVTLLVFDIDDFKRYNDDYGHRAGDEILRQAAVLMRRCCRQHDVVGRIGGDEFAVVFWDVPQPRQVDGKEAERRSAMAEHPQEAIIIANRLLRELQKTELHLLGPAGKGLLTISGGLASFPRDGSTAQELFQRADEALLEAKRSGKNRIYLVGSPAERLEGKAQSDIADIS
jgi:PleD family two-component response regulator